ncbi:MAG: hypothetical protein RSD32_04675, partial [Oscillospiraceae bacterium]
LARKEKWISVLPVRTLAVPRDIVAANKFKIIPPSFSLLIFPIMCIIKLKAKIFGFNFRRGVYGRKNISASGND